MELIYWIKSLDVPSLEHEDGDALKKTTPKW